MAITKRAGNFPYIYWIDLKGDGVLFECAVLKTDNFGNVYYIELPMLDDIDKKRLGRIVTSRNAPNFELWDLMSQVTLNNGINALEYFHQLVKVITCEGVIMNPRAGTVGTGKMDTGNVEQMAAVTVQETSNPTDVAKVRKTTNPTDVAKVRKTTNPTDVAKVRKTTNPTAKPAKPAPKAPAKPTKIEK